MNYFEPGLYVFRITNQGWTETKEKKLPMLVFAGYPTHLITKNPEGEEELTQVYEDPSNPERILRIAIDSKNEDMVNFAITKLRYAGFQSDSFSDLNLVNADIRATCKPGEFKGKPIENWDFALPPLEEREVNELDDKMKRKLDTLFGKRLKASKPKQSEPQQETETEPEPEELASVPEASSDIPF